MQSGHPSFACNALPGALAACGVRAVMMGLSSPDRTSSSWFIMALSVVGQGHVGVQLSL